jgi:hypothetical protein
MNDLLRKMRENAGFYGEEKGGQGSRQSREKSGTPIRPFRILNAQAITTFGAFVTKLCLLRRF